ncbi:MAG: hypothetical protein KDC75_09155, partial [Phaeodactylibacter sp.]|nr:hypothetical protein [Phaeodactylibacter sp.]
MIRSRSNKEAWPKKSHQRVQPGSGGQYRTPGPYQIDLADEKLPSNQPFGPRKETITERGVEQIKQKVIQKSIAYAWLNRNSNRIYQLKSRYELNMLLLSEIGGDIPALNTAEIDDILDTWLKEQGHFLESAASYNREALEARLEELFGGKAKCKIFGSTLEISLEGIKIETPIYEDLKMTTGLDLEPKLNAQITYRGFGLKGESDFSDFEVKFFYKYGKEVRKGIPELGSDLRSAWETKEGKKAESEGPDFLPENVKQFIEEIKPKLKQLAGIFKSLKEIKEYAEGQSGFGLEGGGYL